MAFNKAKVLKSAEKYVIQGKISHAISEYQKLIKEDPTDLPLVNTLGDLHVRIGNIPEAVKCFTKLAESYDNGGFVVRAIAMYKKVSKIDPTQVQALSRLADLYLRQGLISDARAHYLQAADNFIKKGEIENAAAIFKKIIEIDPENSSIEVRLAEAYQKVGRKDEAVRTYYSAAQKLRNKGFFDVAQKYLEKAYELDENNLKVVISCAEVLSDLGRTDEALSYLNRVQFHDFNPEVLEATFNIYLKSGRLEEAENSAAQLIDLDSNYFKLNLTLAKFYMDHADFDKAATTIGAVASLALEKREGQAVENQLKAILDLDAEHAPTLLELIKFHNLSKERHHLPALLKKIGSIYLRQDLLIEAASVYAELVRLEPTEPLHHEYVREIRDRLGREGDLELPALFADQISIAENLVSEPEVKTIASEGEIEAKVNEDVEVQTQSQQQVKSLMVEGDVFASSGLYQKAIHQYQQALEIIPNDIEVHEKIRDMYAKSGETSKAAQESLVLAHIYTTRNDVDNANRNFALAYQYDADLPQKSIYKDQPTQNERIETEDSKEEVSDEVAAVDPRQLPELLAEIDFYFDQGFLAEAKSCIDDYLRLSPPDPELLKRLERYDALSRVHRANNFPSPEIRESSTDSERIMIKEPSLEEFETTSIAAGGEETGEIRNVAEFEGSAITQTADPELKPIVRANPPESSGEMMIDLDRELETSSSEEAAALVSSNMGLGNSDTNMSKAAGDGSGLEDLFAEFKSALEEADSESSDYETYYSLGIAFKEMGLLEEAIGEFQKALKRRSAVDNSEEFVKCCNMLGLCFSEKGLPQVAVKWFTRGLSSPGQDEETYQALRYDLGCAHEQAGNIEAALEAFLEVYSININYRDVAEKIETLKQLL